MTGGGGPTERHIATPPPPQKKNEPEILHPQKIPGIKSFYPTKCRTKYLNTDLFNQQSLGPKKIRDISLDLKNTEAANFQPPKIRRTSPSGLLQFPPPPPGLLLRNDRKSLHWMIQTKPDCDCFFIMPVMIPTRAIISWEQISISWKWANVFKPQL